MRSKALIIDLDGTLCNNKHREHFLKGPKKNWKGFYEAMDKDTVNGWCLKIMNAFSERGYLNILLTGRPELYEEKTRRWLSKSVPPSVWNVLIMRPQDDFRPAPEFKTEVYKTRLKDRYDVLFCIEDAKETTDAWRALGLVCLQCADGEF